LRVIPFNLYILLLNAGQFSMQTVRMLMLVDIEFWREGLRVDPISRIGAEFIKESE